MNSKQHWKIALRKIFILFFVVVTFLAGCAYVPFGYTPIKDIVENPAHYANKEVKVKGDVSDVTKLPFLDTAFYTLTQDNYQIVVTTQGTAPATNSRVVVVGTVENVAIIGDESIGLHLREIKRVDSQFLSRLK